MSAPVPWDGRRPCWVLGALLAGGLAGEAAGLEGRLERLGEAVKRRLGGQARFVEGFVLASLVACVGPLAVLGAFADGLHGDPGLLASSRCWTASPCSPSRPISAGALPPRA
jgi:uncharacterized membrane protein YqgA involved in biofilm formation